MRAKKSVKKSVVKRSVSPIVLNATDVQIENLKEAALEQVAKSFAVEPRFDLSINLITQEADAHHLHRLFNSIPSGVEVVVVFSIRCKDGESPSYNVEISPDPKYGEITTIVNHFEGDFDFSQARNLAIDHSTRKWICWVDSDDELSRNAEEIFESLNDVQDGIGGLFAHLWGYQPQFGNMQQSYYGCDQVRFFRNHPKIRFEGETHEQIIISIRNQMYQLAYSPMGVQHFGYHVSTKEMLSKIERNVVGLAKELASGIADPIRRQGVFDLLERDGSSYNKIIKSL